jgi:hypothetical protein
VTSARRAIRRAGTRISTRLRYLRASGSLRRRVLLGVGGLLLLGVGWLAVTGYLARQQVHKIEDRLQRVQSLVASGRIDDARRAAADIPTAARRAHLLTTGPAWWAGSQLPWLGDPLDVVRGTMSATGRVGTHGIPDLLDVAAAIDPDRLRTAGNTIDTAPLIAAAPHLASAADNLNAAARQIDGLPHHTWLGAVDHPRATLSTQLQLIGGYVSAASRAAQILPSMLGAHGMQRYFVGLQNEAELRGTGGLAGAFAIVEADHGRITFTHFESDAALLPAATDKMIPTGLDFGPGYAAAYGASKPTSLIVNSNLSPNFPYTAQIWARMWQRVSGEHIDATIALDPTTLGYFLAATGPVTLPGRGALTAANVVTLTERDEYTLFSDNLARKAFLVSILKAVSGRLTSGAGSATQLARAASESSREQRLLVWSADPRVESQLAQTNFGGTIPRGKRPFAGVVLNNKAGGKLDFYLTRTMRYQRTGCDARRDVTVTITLTNHAPASGLPPYVRDRLDKHGPSVRPGDNRSLLDYYASDGAELLSVDLNGKPTTAAVEHDLGHPIFRVDLELPRATTQTLVLHLQEPAGVGEPQLWRQPGVTPLAVTYYSQPCG